MSIDPHVLRALVAAGATAEMLIAAVEADAAADEARKAAKRMNNAERQRRFKERKKQEQEANSNADNALPTVTNADGKAEMVPPSPDGPSLFPQTPNSHPLNPPSTSTSEEGAGADVIVEFPKAKARKAERLTRMPADFTLTPGMIAFALREGLTDEAARREFDKFTGHHGAKGSRFVSWNLAWQNWIRNTVDRFGGSRRVATGGHGSSAGSRLGAFQRAAARLDDTDTYPE